MSIKKKTSAFPSLMFFNNAQCSSPSKVFDPFAKFFKIVNVTDDISPFSVESNGFKSNLNICRKYFIAMLCA